MIPTIKKLAGKVLEGTPVKSLEKELVQIYPDELIDLLVRTMVVPNFSFKETILATKEKSNLGFSCLVLMGLVPRSKLFQDSDYCSLTPTIPLVYALQKGFDFPLNTQTIEESKNFLKNSEGTYSLWDNEVNQNAKILSLELALGRTMAKAYQMRTKVPIETIIEDRRKLKHYGYTNSTGDIAYGSSLQYMLDLQLWNARADKRNGRMILDINDWDNLPEAMIA